MIENRIGDDLYYKDTIYSAVSSEVNKLNSAKVSLTYRPRIINI